MAKFAMQTVPPQWLTGSRMAGSCLLMGALFHKSIARAMHRDIIIPALVVGVTYYAAMLAQAVGLQTIDPGRSSFLSGAYCVLIPFVGWAVNKRRPGSLSILAAFICLIGVGFIALKPDSLSLALTTGDWLTLLSALLFSVNLVYLGIYAKRFHAIAVTFVQFAVSSVCFYVGALFTEPLPNASWFTPEVVWSFLYLLIGATMMGQILQNIGLAHVPTSSASIIMSTESLFSVSFAAMFWGERIGWTLIAGFALIFTAIIMSVVKVRHRFFVHPVPTTVGRKTSTKVHSGTPTERDATVVVRTEVPVIRPDR